MEETGKKKQDKAEGELPLDCKVVERADNSRGRRTHGGKLRLLFSVGNEICVKENRLTRSVM